LECSLYEDIGELSLAGLHVSHSQSWIYSLLSFYMFFVSFLFFFFSGINRCCVEQWVCTVTYIEGVPACSSLEPAHNDSKPPIQWMFLNPLTKELWLATVCFVFFTGFVFWMLERSINPEFQGSSLTQFRTALYFVLSTLTFSHGQHLELKLPDNVYMMVYKLLYLPS